MHPDLTAGKAFADVALPDHSGVVRHLTELAGGDPLVLVFFRGWWCPKEQTFLRRLVRLQEEAEVAYTRFVCISVDEPVVLAAFRAGLGARWTFLSDAQRLYQGELGLLETTDTLHRPYVPTVFTLFPDLRIHRVYNGYWFWGRPTMEDLRQDLREVTRQLRADWQVPA
ncbi:MAG TPA: redoxin domain-containing protein [Dermatophilaceae bacterium]|nr:redoxin domain-containing protein [Dermatophilaceae bacterium]